MAIARKDLVYASKELVDAIHSVDVAKVTQELEKELSRVGDINKLIIDDAYWESVLAESMRYGSVELAQLMLKRGANVNYADYHSNSVLRKALYWVDTTPAKSKSYISCLLLIVEKADLSDKGVQAYLIKCKNTHIVDLINALQSYQKTPQRETAQKIAQCYVALEGDKSEHAVRWRCLAALADPSTPVTLQLVQDFDKVYPLLEKQQQEAVINYLKKIACFFDKDQKADSSVSIAVTSSVSVQAVVFAARMALGSIDLHRSPKKCFRFNDFLAARQLWKDHPQELKLDKSQEQTLEAIYLFKKEDEKLSSELLRRYKLWDIFILRLAATQSELSKRLLAHGDHEHITHPAMAKYYQGLKFLYGIGEERNLQRAINLFREHYALGEKCCDDKKHYLICSIIRLVSAYAELGQVDDVLEQCQSRLLTHFSPLPFAEVKEIFHQLFSLLDCKDDGEDQRKIIEMILAFYQQHALTDKPNHALLANVFEKLKPFLRWDEIRDIVLNKLASLYNNKKMNKEIREVIGNQIKDVLERLEGVCLDDVEVARW